MSLQSSSSRIAALATEIPLAALSPLQRVLLTTDGTVTDALEAAFLEQIEIVKVAQLLMTLAEREPRLECPAGETVLDRRVILRGCTTGTPYVHAESLIAVDRLSPTFRRALLESNLPIGRLWQELKLETFKELIEIRRARSDESSHFLSDHTVILARSYRVFTQGVPIMVIKEYLPWQFSEI